MILSGLDKSEVLESVHHKCERLSINSHTSYSTSWKLERKPEATDRNGARAGQKQDPLFVVIGEWGTRDQEPHHAAVGRPQRPGRTRAGHRCDTCADCGIQGTSARSTIGFGRICSTGKDVVNAPAPTVGVGLLAGATLAEAWASMTGFDGICFASPDQISCRGVKSHHAETSMISANAPVMVCPLTS